VSVQVEIVSPRPGHRRPHFSSKKVRVLFGSVDYYLYIYTHNQNRNDMNDMDLISEFVISSIGNEVEDITIYDDNHTEDSIEKFLNKLIEEKKIIIGEKCEGTIEMDDTNIRIEYKWCSEVGEDWDSDVWEDEVLELPKGDYEM
jgi:hypothetical protein